MRRAAISLAILLALAIPGTAIPSTAFADGGDEPQRAAGGPVAEAWGTSEASTALMRSQAPQVEAANDLEAAIGALAGFTSIGLDSTGLVLRWKGPPPAIVTAAIKRLPAAVPVRIESARYSRMELEKAAGLMRHQIEAGRGNGVHTIALRPDGGGLRLGVDALDGDVHTVTAGNAGQPTAAQRTAVAKAVKAAGVAVDITVTVEARIQLTSRENDFAPWAGGIVIADRQPGSLFYGETCTGGFGIRNTGDARTYLVTASHCGTLGDAFADPTGEQLGTVWWRDGDRGIALIRTAVSGELYLGGPVGQPQSIKGVAGWSTPYFNQSLCASAAYTGNICGLAVFDMSEVKCGSEPGQSVKCWGPLIGVKRTNGERAGRPGDSGGPLYYNSGTRANVVGFILGGDDAAILWIVSAKSVYEAFDGVDDPDLNLTVVTRSF